MNVKSIFKTMAMAVACLGTLTFAACDSDDEDPTPSDELKLSATKVKVAPEATARITVENGAEPLTVKSGNEKVVTATVDKKTVTVLGIAEGAATVLVSDNNQRTANISVTVKNTIPAGLTFDRTAATVGVGKEVAIAILSGTAPYTVKSDNEKVATATVTDNRITVKGIKAGVTTVGVTDKEKKTGTLLITVK